MSDLRNSLRTSRPSGEGSVLHLVSLNLSVCVEVSQEQIRMSVRKQIVQEAKSVPTEIIIDDNTQELESEDDRGGKVED